MNAGRTTAGTATPARSSTRGDDARARHREAAALHRLAEELAVLGAADHVDGRAEQLDAERVEDALVGQLDREVERRLAAERRQQRVGPLAAEHVGDALEVERLEVGARRRSPGRS